MKDLFEAVRNEILDINEAAQTLACGAVVDGTDVDIKIKGDNITVSAKGSHPIVYIRGEKAKALNMSINAKDKIAVSIKGSSLTAINLSTSGTIGGLYLGGDSHTDLPKCATIDLSDVTIDGILDCYGNKGIKTLIGPKGVFAGQVSRNVNLESLDLSNADSLNPNVDTAYFRCEKNKKLKNLKLPETAYGQCNFDTFLAPELVQAGLKNLGGAKPIIFAAEKSALLRKGGFDAMHYDKSGALKKPYQGWFELDNGNLDQPKR